MHLLYHHSKLLLGRSRLRVKTQAALRAKLNCLFRGTQIRQWKGKEGLENAVPGEWALPGLAAAKRRTTRKGLKDAIFRQKQLHC